MEKEQSTPEILAAIAEAHTALATANREHREAYDFWMRLAGRSSPGQSADRAAEMMVWAGSLVTDARELVNECLAHPDYRGKILPTHYHGFEKD